MKLYEIEQEYAELSMLAENGELDEQCFADTKECIDAELEVKAVAYAKIIKNLTAESDAIKEEIARLSSRSKTLETNAKKLKDNLERVMIISDTKKIKTSLFSFNVQKNPPKLIVTGEVPSKYLIDQAPKVDSAALKDLLKNGQVLDFATLETSESLRIR